MYDFHITEDAQSDLSIIKNYTSENFGLDQAEIYMAALFDGINTLRTHPKVGYRLTLKRHNLFCYQIEHHRIIYKINDTTVVVLSVLHKRQLPTIHMPDRLG